MEISRELPLAATFGREQSRELSAEGDTRAAGSCLDRAGDLRILPDAKRHALRYSEL